MNESNKQSYFALACVLSVNFFVAYQFFSTSKFDTVYSTEKLNDNLRAPASQKVPGNYQEYKNLYPIEEYVIYDDFDGTIDYKMEVEFWSDKGEKYFTKNGKKAIEEGLKTGFERLIKKGMDENTTFKSVVIPELTKEFLNTFVYSIKVLKLIDSNFEFDIMFRPYTKDTQTYKDELKTNQLVNIDTTGSLTQEYKSYNKNFTNAILTTPIPISNEQYQYLGGAITLAAELIDTNWKITNPIPNPKKNGIKGFVRLRKYYRVNSPSDLKLEGFSSKSLKITDQSFSTRKKHPPVITVDSIYEYNLKDIVPKKKKTIIHFGEIVSLDKKEDNFFKRLFTFFKKKNDIKTSSYKFKGDFSSGPIRTHFDGKIRKLVYDHSTKKFTSKSRIHTSPLDFDQSTRLRAAIKRTLLNENSDYLIKKLSLEDFINN